MGAGGRAGTVGGGGGSGKVGGAAHGSGAATSVAASDSTSAANEGENLPSTPPDIQAALDNDNDILKLTASGSVMEEYLHRLHSRLQEKVAGVASNDIAWLLESLHENDF